MAGKKYRIAKVAAELNVGYEALLDFLAGKGEDVERKPTAKISGELYDILLKEFQSDKDFREKSKTIKEEKKEKKEAILKEVPKVDKTPVEPKIEKEILIKDVTSSPLEEKVVKAEIPKIALKQVGKIEEKPVEKEEQKVEAPKEIVKEEVKPVIKEAPKAEEIKAKKEELKGTKIVGKVNLSPPVKKEEPKKEEPKKEEPKKVVEPIKKEEPKVEEPKVIPKKEVASVVVANKLVEEEKRERIETNLVKLSGPKVTGKIVIKEEPKRTKRPIASSDNADKKRKRKKIPAKVDINKNHFKKGVRKTSEPKEEISEKQIQDKIKATLAKLEGAGKNKGAKQKRQRQKREDLEVSRAEEAVRLEKEGQIIKVTEFVTANDLATMMDIGVNDVITACFSLGLMVSINQRLDAETITVVADEFGFEVDFVDADTQIAIEEIEDKEEDLVARAPVVTVMGHVDHGKTSLLDFIRSANVISGEAGGITQHIGSYEVKLDDGKKITFLDTPGHEAFTAMRARGAQVTDIVIVVIAADDDVMPQTKEAISHAQAAGVPIVFALNKMDKETAQPDKIRDQLSQMNILVEEWGGKFQCQEISAKKGTNVDLLLEKVMLEAELLELKANPERLAKGTVIEARLDKGKGIVTSLLVQAGTLRVGDHIIAGPHYGKVKAMMNERNQKVQEVGPSSPVTILGFSQAPAAGDSFNEFETESDAKDLASKRLQLLREQGIRTTKHITLDEIGRRLAVGNFKELNLIVKGDVDGSVEALSDSFLKLSTEEIQINVIHKSVGQISENDVLLASASDAIIIGFQVRPAPKARVLAEQEQIDIRLYSIIYKAIEEMQDAMEGLLSPDVVEKVTGTAEIREIFRISKVGTIAGCMIKEGKIVRGANLRLIRDGVVVYSGKMGALKRFKDDVKEVAKGYECGISFAKYNELEEGDLIEAYVEEEVKRTLKKK
jgi:translation initiation factor IF-2